MSVPSSLRESRSVVTLDGLAGSGKSSLASALAQRLGFINFNSGLLYRTVGHLAIAEGVDQDDETALAALIRGHTIAIDPQKVDPANTNPVTLDGVQLQADLRRPEVSEATSRVSRFASVRELLLPLQRAAYPGRNLVAEGRDMGTVVFPDAQVKFFVSASVEVRVARRLKQLGLAEGALSDGKSFEAGGSANLEAIRREIIERDQRDSSRAVAPTVAAKDAFLIDNSNRPFELVVSEMVQIVRSRIQLC